MPKIICFLPKAGLANQLFLIASTELYAYKYGLPVKYKNKWQIKIGPYIRGEKNKRNYFGFFKFQKIEFNILKKEILVKIRTTIQDPKLSDIPKEHTIYEFKSLPHWSSFFDNYIPHRELVKELLFNQLSEKIQIQVQNLHEIDVAVHVRLGDFQKLKDSVDFSKVGATRTPLGYFKREIENVKNQYPDFIFYVFSDGYPEELRELTLIKNVFLYETKNDIIDLYQMSKSKILITSAGSTYSYWAGFLGECEVIQHPDHLIKIK